MSRARAASAAAVAVMLWPLSSSAGDSAIAREQLKIGYTLAQEGKCQEAVPHLSESLRLDPKAITIINLADCEEKIGKLADALGHWVDARARAQIEGARPIEEEAEKRATALEPRLARLTIVLPAGAPPDATVERDGVVLGPPSLGIPLPIDPGPHTVVVRAKGRVDGAMHVALGEGESKRIEVDVGPAAPPVGNLEPAVVASDAGHRSANPLVFVGFGVGAVGLAVGAITGAMALDAGNDAEKACPDPSKCNAKTIEDVDSARTVGTVSTIGFVIAALGAGVGIYGLLAPPAASRGATKARTSVGVSLTPSSFALRGRF